MRKYDIQAKPTKYRNIKFRSRLEARWAVFFTALRVGYKYEWQSYLIKENDTHIYYLPDFWLKEWIVEIKPNEPLREEYYKAMEVSYQDDIAIISGNPNPDCIIYLFQDGKQVFVKPSRMEAVYCAVRGINIRQWTTLKMLSLITGKKDFYKAFEKAERYKF